MSFRRYLVVSIALCVAEGCGSDTNTSRGPGPDGSVDGASGASSVPGSGGASGSTGGKTGGTCVEGQSLPCACTNGAMGAQRCTAAGTLGDCVCAGSGGAPGAGGNKFDAGIDGSAGAGRGGSGPAAGGTDGSAGHIDAAVDASGPGAGGKGGANASGGAANGGSTTDAAVRGDSGDAAPDGGTPPAPGEFGAECTVSGDCHGGLTCARPDLGVPTANAPGFCTVQNCDPNSTGQCPAPPSGTATSRCGQLSHNCLLDCSAGASCPIGMECQSISGFMLCGRPRKALEPLYGRCSTSPDCASGVCSGLGYCTQNCVDVSTCTAPSTGNATLMCLATNPPTPGPCALSCAGSGITCPSGMTCRSTTPIKFCGY